MKNSPAARSKINREIYKRGFNTQAKKVIAKHTPEEEMDDLHIDFHCECSDPSCTVQVPMTIQEYDEVHEDKAAFIIATGHETPSIEEIDTDLGDQLIVKKFALDSK